ncbi:MAG TPA: cytochrome c biogenesis protein ResB [Ktedonobacterales bacterium]|jgi:cytochrome c biogenesis protein
MSTTHAPRVVSRRRAASKAAPPRHTNRYRRYWKHPVNSLWGLFSSVKTAIVLIALIAVVCIIGIIVIQAPVEITSSPNDFALWVSQEMGGKYGPTWTSIFSSLGFFTIFSMWYFKALMVLLAINVAICTLNRAPGIWYNFRNPAVRTNERFYQNALARQDFDTNQDVEGIRRFFRKKHYRVLVKEGSGSGATYLYAYKNAWATLSTFVFHACLVSLMLATVLTGWHGFGTNSMAQHILPEPIYNYLQNLAGFSYTQPLPDGENGVVYPIGTAHNIEYRADQFVARFNPTNGQPTDFYTDLTLFQDGKQVAQQRIRVNDPLTYQGVTFHQASFILYAWITITDAKGNVIFNQKPVLNESLNDINPNTGNSVPVSIAENIPIPNVQQDMNVAATLTPDGWAVIVNGSDLKGNPSFCSLASAGNSAPVIDLSQSNLSCSKAFAALQLGQQGLQLKGWTLDVKLVKQGTVLLITKDSGSPLIWPISALLILSLCVTFYFPQRRVWMRFRDGHLQFAGLKEHFINVQRDFNSLALELAALDAKAGRTTPRERLKDPPGASAAEMLKPKSAKSSKSSAGARARAAEAEEAEATAPSEVETEASDADASEMTDEAEETSQAHASAASHAKKEVAAGD